MGREHPITSRTGSSPSLLAIIPAYCEEKHIGEVVTAVKGQGLDVVVIDDASTDRTEEVARKAGATVIRLPTNLGYGGALQAGYRYACSRDYEAVVQLDGDGQHDPAHARELAEPILTAEAHIVLGSRFLTGACYRVPRLRRAGQRLFGWVARRCTGWPITDPTTGYQALALDVARFYCTRVFPDDYPDSDMFIILKRMGFRVCERPVRMYAGPVRSMHSGFLRPLYYVCKMSLAMVMAMCRRLPEGDYV